MISKAAKLGVAAAVAAAPVAGVAAAQPVAAVACGAAAGSHHVVIQSFDPTNGNHWPFGVQAKVRAQNGSTCTGNPSEGWYNAWVMLHEKTGGGYAQTGFVHDPSTVANPGIWHFGQSKKGTGVAATTDWYLTTPAAAGTEYKYTTNIDTSINRAVMLAGVNTVHTSDFNPLVEWPTGPFALQYGGEADNLGDGIPGNVNNKTVFRELSYHSATGWVTGFPATSSLGSQNDDAAPDPPVWKLSVNNCGGNCFSIWTE